MTAPELIDILACPVCKGTLTPSEEAFSLLCRGCGLIFRTQDGIPIMLVEQAERFPE